MAEKSSRRRHKTEPPPLSAREIRFAQLFLEYGRRGQARAYLEAGFPPRDTQNATEAAACRLVRKRQVRAYVRDLQDAAAEAAMVTVEEIARGLRRIAAADRGRLFDRFGRLRPVAQWPADVAATVEAVEVEEVYEPVPGQPGKRQLRGYVRKVKTARRLEAWRLLAQWRRMVGEDKQEAGGKGAGRLTVSEDVDDEGGAP